jgi:hypothetical protein
MEKELQWDLQEADEYLQELFAKQKDFGKAVDKAMSDTMTVLQGEKISPNHVMSRLEHTITGFNSRKELDRLVKFFLDYFEQLDKIEKHMGKIGRTQCLRMRYYRFNQQIQYYAAARVFWGEKSPVIDDLMNTLEIIVMRKLVLMDGRISALFYQLSPGHFKLIREAGKSSDKQVECVEKIRKQFEKSNENPTDNEITKSLETRTFNLDNTGSKNKLIIALLCLESNTKYSNFQFKNNQNNPKIAYYMPKYDGNKRGYIYPTMWYKREDCHQYIGNCFLLKEAMTQAKIKETKLGNNERGITFHNNGNQFETYQKLLNVKWGESEIDERTKKLAKLLIQRFPRNCKK